MAYTFIASSGTISVADGDTAVTGVDTAFALLSVEGGFLVCEAGYGAVASVESDTALTLEAPLIVPAGSGGGAVVDGPYLIYRGTSSAADAVRIHDQFTQFRQMIEQIQVSALTRVSAYGANLAGRALYDDEYLDVDGNQFIYAYIENGVPIYSPKLSETSGDWGPTFSFAGPRGAAATIEVGSTTTGDAGTEAAVTNSGTSSAAVLDIVIPRGDKGYAGWAMEPELITDGNRRVIRVSDWIGGEGTKPDGIGKYVGVSGLVTNIASAIDVRGGTGAQGETGLNFMGAWQSSQNYYSSQSDIVVDDDADDESAVWIAIADSLNKKPRDNLAEWAPFPASFPRRRSYGAITDPTVLPTRSYGSIA